MQIVPFCSTYIPLIDLDFPLIVSSVVPRGMYMDYRFANREFWYYASLMTYLEIRKLYVHICMDINMYVFHICIYLLVFVYVHDITHNKCCAFTYDKTYTYTQ